MVFFNWATMQMAAKIVYYGPGLGGKTTNLSFIYAKTAPGSRGEMVSLETETDRTLFFDLLPIEVGKVAGFRTRLQLYTVPGQVFYNTTRKLVLKGVDGVVFVADSQKPMAEANVESFYNLEENLKELGLDTKGMPLVLQYNKRDLRNILPLDDLNGLLNPEGRWESFEAVAVDGIGVFDTLKAITKQTLKALRRRMVSHEGAGTVAVSPAASRPVAFNPVALKEAAAEGLGGDDEKSGGEVVAPPAQADEAVAEEAPQHDDLAASPPDPSPESVIEEAGAPLPDSPEAETTNSGQPVKAEEVTEAIIIEDAGEPIPDDEASSPGGGLVEEEMAIPTSADEPASGRVADEAEAGAEDLGPLIAAVELDAEDAREPARAGEPEDSVEDGSQTDVDFDTTPEPAAATEMRRVRVSSSLDILSELESLRKASTWESPQRDRDNHPQASLDLDSLLRSSLNSRREVKRRVEQSLGEELRRIDRCTVTLDLLDSSGRPVSHVEPITVELAPEDQPSKHLSLILTFNLRGE